MFLQVLTMIPGSYLILVNFPEEIYTVSPGRRSLLGMWLRG